MWKRGANIPTIDKAVMDALGIGMGPFKLVNVTGVPIAYHVSQSLFDQIGHSFYAPSARLKAQFESGEDFPLDGEVDEGNLDKVTDRLLGAVMGFPETGIGIYPGLGGTQRTSRFVGKELAKYIIFTGRLISANDALSIGLVDYVFAPDQIDDKILALIKEDRPALRKGKKTEELPQDWRKLKELFADANIDAWLGGKYIESDDPLVAKTAKIVASKAPIALRLSNQIVDQGYEKPLKEGVKEELAHLYEIFSTKDALTGLTSVGRERPKFEGK